MNRPWEVRWVDFGDTEGHEQAGMRPAVVVSSLLGCRLANGLTFVVPCTRTDRGLHHQPRVVLGGTPGVVLCDQLRAVADERVHGRVRGARLSPEEIGAIQAELRLLLALVP